MKQTRLCRLSVTVRTLLVVSLVTALLHSGALSKAAATQKNTPERERALLEAHISGLSSVFKDSVDVRVKIAMNLRKVAIGEMGPEQFYKELAQMKMPGGREQRFILMEVKRDIAKYRGEKGLEFFLGTQYRGEKEGGSEVEEGLLTFRKEKVMEVVNKVIQEFQGKNVVDGIRYSVYYAEIGGWPNETPRQMTFAGDIDINFQSGNLELAWRMKEAYDIFIKVEIGMSAEAFDAPCTVHGMATQEVYVEKHGQTFAERLLREKESILKEIDFENGSRLGDLRNVEFEVALQNMVTEAKFAAIPLPNLKKIKWPGEPGITLEMLRHFEHDIMGQNVYTDLESFMKAAKYMNRSDKAVEEGGGQPSNEKLSQFCADMIEHKESGQETKSGIIREYFESINEPFPIEVTLGSTVAGETKVSIRMKEKVIRDFWNTCKKTMWQNANKGFEIQVKQMKTRIRNVNMENGREVRALAMELDKMREMIEVEMRVLEDPRVGIHEIQGEFRGLVEEFRTEFKSFVQDQNYIKFQPVELRKSYKFIDELLRAGQPSSVRLAMGALVHSPEFINSYLDVLDDKLLGKLRGETGPSWHEFVSEARELRWADKVEQFLKPEVLGRKVIGGGIKISERMRAHLDKAEKISHSIEEKMNTMIFENLRFRHITNVNQLLSRSIQSSSVGRTGMKAMIAFNLAEEIPVYVNLFWEGEWEEMAVEFFRRRVPFGAAIENVIMGQFIAAAWNLVVTFVPPAALGEVAFRIGEDLGRRSLKLWWSTELNLFIDTLYENSEFDLVGVENYQGKLKLSKWKLSKVTYNGVEIDVDPFLERKRQFITKMHQALNLPYAKREFGFVDKEDGITDWIKVNNMLEENLASQDHLLVFIRELKNYSSVGPKLKANYWDQYLTRWEEVKLAFIKHLIARLEERRTAHQAQLSGQLPEMVAELERISEELAIKKQVMEHLEEETGSGFIQFLAWLRDYMVGIKRAYYEQADVWDSYEEGVRIVNSYLKVFKRILDARTQIEKTMGKLDAGKIHDSGLRILTGPEFLTGKAGHDDETYKKWARLPFEIAVEVNKKLLTIKREYIPGADIDQEESSFDQDILRKVVHHDLWRPLWKHVFSVSQNPIPGSPIAVSIDPGYTESGRRPPDVQKYARLRHTYHKRESDKLIELFRQHYFKAEIKHDLTIDVIKVAPTGVGWVIEDELGEFWLDNVPGAKVLVTPISSNSPSGTAITDEGGIAVLKGFMKGKYRCTVTYPQSATDAKDYEPNLTQEVEVEGDSGEGGHTLYFLFKGNRWAKTIDMVSHKDKPIKLEGAVDVDKRMDQKKELWKGAVDIESHQDEPVKLEGAVDLDKRMDQQKELWKGAVDIESHQDSPVELGGAVDLDKRMDQQKELWKRAVDSINHKDQLVKPKVTARGAQLPPGDQNDTVFGNQEGPHIEAGIDSGMPNRPWVVREDRLGGLHVIPVDQLPPNDSARQKWKVEIERWQKWQRNQGGKGDGHK